MCTGHTWYQVAPTIRYEFEGIKPSAVSGKDIFLHIANVYGDAANLNLEYGGPGLAALAMNVRRAITTPRPIRGHGVHHYRFHLLALDQPVRGSVTTVKSLLNAISDHVPSRAILTGARPKLRRVR